MKLCRYQPTSWQAPGFYPGLIHEDFVYSLHGLMSQPETGLMGLHYRGTGDLFGAMHLFPKDQFAIELVLKERAHYLHREPLGTVRLGVPIKPRKFRDFYGFVEHVRNARSKRGLDVPPEWYQVPHFYHSNADTLLGWNDDLTLPDFGPYQNYDYELEVGCVIGRKGRNISVDDAEDYIAGYVVLNDWSLRDLQRVEMVGGLGPANSKAWATTLGPCLVTPDELAPYRCGRGYNLKMTAHVNNELYSQGNWCTIHFSFAEMVSWASRADELRPGDIFGSGTVGKGCILELHPQKPYLKSGDIVVLTIEQLGSTTTRIL